MVIAAVAAALASRLWPMKLVFGWDRSSPVVAVGEGHDRDRTTVIKEREPAERTTVIKKERDDGVQSKTIIKDRD